MRVNGPALSLFGACVWCGQALSLSGASDRSSFDLVLLLFLITAFTLVSMLGAALLLNAVGGRWRIVAWTGIFLVAAACVCDAVSYSWLRLHLDDSLRMLYWYVQANPVGIATKLMGLTVAAILLLAAAAAIGIIASRFDARSRRWRRRHVVAVAAAAVAMFLAADVLAARQLTPTGHQLRRYALLVPEVAAGAVRGGAAEIEAPRFRQLPAVESARTQIERITPQRIETPLNVFFFVVESMRADTAASSVMPFLSALADQALPARATVAGGNCTHVSWVSLLHGVNPVYWTVRLRQPQHDGAVAVQALVRAGYRVHAYSPYDLTYFGADRALFGSDLQLVDEIAGQAALSEGLSDPNIAELDERVFERLQQAAARTGQTRRNLYFAFLGALHHGYEWPRTFAPPFSPFLPDGNIVLRGMRASSAPLLKARYDNAARFTDTMFERFFAFLDATGLRETSMVVIAGDHGEEFLETGNLVHSSALNNYQVETPILIVLPPSMRATLAANPDRFATHADVFPTVLDVIGLDADVQGLMTGSSLLDPDGGRFATSAHCSTHGPERLLVQTPSTKVLLEVDGVQKRGYSLFARALRATGMLDAAYRPIALDPDVLARPDVRDALSAFVNLDR